jgi:hypothetical protein
MKTLPVALVLASAVLIAALAWSTVTELSRSAPAHGEQVIIPAPRTLVSDIEVKKVSSKYKYKSEDVDDAQQTVQVMGTCPTSYENFDQIGSFAVAGGEQGQPDSFNHSFMRDPTGVMGRKGTRYKQKFFPWTAAKSDHHNINKYKTGMFKAWIRDGELKFIYLLAKANEAGKMVETNDYAGMRTTLAETNKAVKGNVAIDAGLQVGGEGHGVIGTCDYKASKKTAKAKLAKN